MFLFDSTSSWFHLRPRRRFVAARRLAVLLGLCTLFALLPLGSELIDLSRKRKCFPYLLPLRNSATCRRLHCSLRFHVGRVRILVASQRRTYVDEGVRVVRDRKPRQSLAIFTHFLLTGNCCPVWSGEFAWITHGLNNASFDCIWYCATSIYSNTPKSVRNVFNAFSFKKCLTIFFLLPIVKRTNIGTCSKTIWD